MAMLQFGGALCSVAARFSPRSSWRIRTQRLLAASSSAAISPSPVSSPTKQEETSEDGRPEFIKQSNTVQQNPLVQKAFDSLKKSAEEDDLMPKKSIVDQKIHSAATVNDLLTLAESSFVSRRQALKIISILSEWSNKKKIEVSKFQEDPRFLKLCRMLGRYNVTSRYAEQEKNEDDLATILGLTRADEAAKLISEASLPQMVKVMSTLAQKRRRSTPLLRTLAFNLSRSQEKVNIKQAADLLYSAAILNFPDEVLLQKTCSDLVETIPGNTKTAVIGSILTSLGLLRYKDEILLNTLCEWVASYPDALRPQDLTSLLLTLATVAYTPANAQILWKELVEPLKVFDMPGLEEWLDVVWSLVVLGQATPEHVASVLDPDFLKKLTESANITIAKKVKLLNINAAAQLIIRDYKGPFLEEQSDIFKVPLDRSRDRQLYMKAIVDALSNLLPSSTYLSTNINTGMGFILDAECYVDDKCNPISIENSSGRKKKATRIAVVGMDYNDLCRGREGPTGIIMLGCKLLEAKGYRILPVPHMEFSPQDKLVERVQYLQKQIKSIVKNTTT